MAKRSDRSQEYALDPMTLWIIADTDVWRLDSVASVMSRDRQGVFVILSTDQAFARTLTSAQLACRRETGGFVDLTCLDGELICRQKTLLLRCAGCKPTFNGTSMDSIAFHATATPIDPLQLLHLRSLS